MDHTLLAIVLLTAGDELPQHRHARLLREAAQNYNAWKTPDVERTVALTNQFESQVASWPEPLRGWQDVSPYAIAGLGVCAVALLALVAMTWLVARPNSRRVGLNQR